MAAAEPKEPKPAPRVDVQGLVKFYGALKAKRLPWESLWQDIATYVVPRKYPGLGATVSSPTGEDGRLWNSTAVHAHQINAAGCLAWMTPESSPWFSYGPPSRIKDQSARKWLAEASQTAREMLGQSPFYLAAHEGYLDRGGFGTMCIYAERGEDGKLHFENWELGTYVISVDHRKKVNTVVREFKLSALNAAEKFGKENLPEKIQKCLEKGDKSLDEFTFLHFIMPRAEAQQQAGGGEALKPQQQMPWACYYVAMDGGKSHLCRESGYRQKPFFVSRYLEWGTGLGWPYGWAPAFAALPDARQCNWIDRNLDALAELMAFPSWVAPAELEGDIDPNPAGVTYVDGNLDHNKWPRQNPTPGRYDVGLDRVKRKEEAINRAFHVEMFQMLTMMEKPPPMTAREISARESEKLIPFSPTFSRIKTEFTSELLQWLFDEMLMAADVGPIESIPQSLAIKQKNGIFVIPPAIQYNSRMEMAMQQLPTLGMYNLLDLCATVAAGQNLPPYDNFNWDKGVRNAAVKYGVEPEVIFSETEVADVRQARAEARQAEEEAAAQLAGSETAKNLGTIKPDSVVGKALAA